MESSSLMSGDSELLDLTQPKWKAAYLVIGTQDLPDALKDLYLNAEINSNHDAIVILLHAFMLEAGFIPKGIAESEKLKLLPKDWHKKELYSVVYCHSTCPEVCCSMTCIPLYQHLSVFGTVTDEHTSQEPPNICLQVRRYVNNDSIGSSNPSKIFFGVKELSQSFKDEFAYPMLAVLQDALGFGPTFGLSAAMDDVKMQILRCLSVGALVAMSCVNKEFNELCNSSALWKKLYLKDFSNGVGNHDEANQDWKKLYKEKYLKKKQKRAFFPHVKFIPSVAEEWLWCHPLCRTAEDRHNFPFEAPPVRVFDSILSEARPHNVIRPPPFPHNPLLNIPRGFQP